LFSLQSIDAYLISLLIFNSIESILTGLVAVTVCSIRCADFIIRGLFVRTIQKCRVGVAVPAILGSVVGRTVMDEALAVCADRVLYDEVMITKIIYKRNVK